MEKANKQKIMKDATQEKKHAKRIGRSGKPKQFDSLTNV